MNRRRQNCRTLTGSRIYIRRGKYTYFAPEPIVNKKTGKAVRWHVLCPIQDGELKARQVLAELLETVNVKGPGDFCVWFSKWRTNIMLKRTQETPKDPARAAIWEKGSKGLLSVLGVIEHSFSDFNLVQITPADVAEFVDQWEGKRSAQSYKGHLSKFFSWCCRRRLMNTNPANDVTVEAPKKRETYMTDEQYSAIQKALLVGNDGKPTRAGPMVQVYMDLLYLLYQRGTDVRLLKWDQVADTGILFRPTKTEKSSGARVLVPIGEDTRKVLERAKSLRRMASVYVIHTERGQPYTAHGIGSIFERACERAGVEGVTLKDIRAKAATDAKKAGYEERQLQTALAHTDPGTTRVYLRSREIPVSEVVLRLPQSKK